MITHLFTIWLLLSSVYCVSKINVKTKKLSTKGDLPFDFYSLKAFCRPQKISMSAESIGEAIFGDRIENSIFNFAFDPQETIQCQLIKSKNDIYGKETKDEKEMIQCPNELDADSIIDLENKIRNQYEVQLMVQNLPFANRQSKADCGNLPSASIRAGENQRTKYVQPEGFPLGCTFGDDVYVNNHWHFIIKYHKEEDGLLLITGAEVIPSSIDHSKLPTCDPLQRLPARVVKMKVHSKTSNIQWSYSLSWEESEIKWASRWDAYADLDPADTGSVHWFTIINSILIVLVLTSMVSMIMYRVLARDIRTLQNDEDDMSWKSLHGDVFRPPFCSLLLCVLYGNGIQMIFMVVLTLGFALLGLSNPTNRGSIFSIMILCFGFMGFIGGYNSLRMYRSFDGKYWKLTSLLTALALPGIIFIIFLCVNAILYFGSHSSSALPFLVLFKIFFLWMFCSVPLVSLGGYFGFTRPKIEPPTPINSIPRLIPTQPWYLQSLVIILIGGILPFSAIFIEVYFILSSIWLHKFFLVFGFLFIVFLIFLITIAETAMILTYFQLNSLNYKWWWVTYLSSASTAGYFFLYSVVYFYTKLKVNNFMMALVYFEYTLIVSWICFLLAGSAGLISTIWFLRKLYAAMGNFTK